MKHPTLLVVASIPAALAGAFALGVLADPGAPGASGFWQLRLLESTNPVGDLVIGLAFLLPLVAVSLAVSGGWATVFSRMRRRPRDAGWFSHAWLFALLLPAAMPPAYAALGLSFGLVFACHLFGGSDRQLVSPAVLAIVFLELAYPPLFEAGRWIPGLAVDSGWAALNVTPAAGSAGTTFYALLLGQEAGALGAPSALACIVGLALLLFRSAAVPSIIAGAIVAAAAAGLMFDQEIGLRHLVVGNFTLALAFFATDPAIRPATRVGRWSFGILFGGLTVLIRTLDPAGPEGTWQALLLASLCVPLLDRIGALARSRSQRGEAPARAERMR